MIDLVVLGFGLAAVAAVAIAVTEALVRRAEVGAALLLSGALITAIFGRGVPAAMLTGGIRVEVLDVAFTLLLAAAILRLLRMPRFTPWQRWTLLVSIMLLLSLVRGATAFGPQHAIAEFRLFVAFVAGALYFCTFPPSSRMNDRIGRIWLALSIPMMILVCLRWLDTFAGIDLGVPAAEFGADAEVKVLNGPYTLFLANAFILTVPFWQLPDRRSRRLTWLGALLLLFVVLLNRRTAWLAIIVGIAVMMVRNRRFSRRLVAMVVGAVLLAIGGYVALGGSKGEEKTVATSAVGTGTLDWRIQGWVELLGGMSTDPVKWGIGEPLGSDFTREVLGAQVEAEPHNFYLSHLLRAGVVGLLALIALTGGLLRSLWRRIPASGGRDGLLAPSVFPALLAMQIVWFLVWTPGMEQGIITGLAAGLAAYSRGRVRVLPARPPRVVTGADV
jgi:O-antigen ligase